MNVDITCPQCGTVYTVGNEVVGKRTKCVRCGTLFTISEPVTSTKPPAPATSQTPNFPTSTPPSPPQAGAPIFPQIVTEPAPRTAPPAPTPAYTPTFHHEPPAPQYPMLRFVALAYEILAGISILIAVALLVFFFITAISRPENALNAFFATGLAILWAIIIAISLLASAQMIRLVLQMEINTRETYRACRQLADHLCSIEAEP
jgi:predicted Zn finger-like uncharacterized protein